MRSLDRAAGRAYTRILAIATGIISASMLLLASISWTIWGPLAGWTWLVGALVFGMVARACWRSRAAISDMDFTH